jgi:hypothetical protein
MPEFNSIVEMNFGDGTLALESTDITLKTISLYISDEQLQILRRKNKGRIFGSEALLKINCGNDHFEINNKTYAVRCIASSRLSSSKFLLVMEFFNLYADQKMEIIKSVSRLY